MTYGRIEQSVDLPPSGAQNARSREKADLDFKVFADERQPWEHAKDIAAFANALGGVLLVGADEARGQLAYPGLQGGQTMADLKRIYEGAAQTCSPTPVVDVIAVDHAGVTLVAVNVDPFIDQAVAAPAGSRDKQGNACKHDAAWVFPIRRASQTEYIQPEALPMYMNREIRRAVLLLSRIPLAARAEVTVHYSTQRELIGRHWDGVMIPARRKLALEDVSVEKNRVRFRAGNAFFSIPLLDVADVWESLEGRWDLRVLGDIRPAKGGQLGDIFEYMPLAR